MENNKIDPNELQFLFDLNGAKTLDMGDAKSVSRAEFYGKILETIATVSNKEEKTNHKVYFISFDDKGLKYSIKGKDIIQYQEAYNFLINQAIQNVHTIPTKRQNPQTTTTNKSQIRLEV